nr:hypothetical protein [Tanacetum cinerariifolium]
MVAILEKGEYNTDFHPMVDFIAASPLRTYNFSKMIFDGMVKNVHNKISKSLMYPRFLTICLRGEGSGTPTEPHHTPSPEADPSYHTTSSMTPLSIPTAPIPPVTQPVTTPIWQYTRRVRNAQSSALLTVADEPTSLVRDVSEREACPTESGFIAYQDRATIAKSSTLPHDSAPRVTSPAADEGTQEVEILKLKDRVKVLEDREGIGATRSGDDAPIKGRSIDEGETATERISDDSKELARVLTSMDAATVLAGGIDREMDGLMSQT